VLGVLATRLFETPTYVVPDLTEMPEPEARNLIASNGWVISVTQERSDEVPTEGLVVRTRPQAGVELAEGEPFLIVVSAGPELRPLPDSTGLPLGVAQTRLLEADLVVQEVVEEFDELVPDGTVVSWSVPTDPTLVAGSQVEPGTPVVLVVSKGPEPRVVPDLVGRAIGGVRDELSGLGLQVDVASREFSDDAPLGTVMSQDTAPGTEVERGSTVSVVVSRGPDLVSFPDLSDAANFDEAAELLRAAGFEAELVFGDAQGEIQSIDVDGAEPDVGETFRRGTLVRIRAFDTQ
jgi:beta-lactam-binding protein with PASTA domain